MVGETIPVEDASDTDELDGATMVNETRRDVVDDDKGKGMTITETVASHSSCMKKSIGLTVNIIICSDLPYYGPRPTFGCFSETQ